MTTTTYNKARFALAPLLLAGAAAVLVTAVPQAAHAQRKSPLADAPAIRKRLELRETRVELGVGWTSTVAQDYFHSQLITGRLAFHLTDWLSIAGVGGYGLAQIETAYHSRLSGSLSTMPNVPREPSFAEANASMQQIKWMAAAQLELTPFTGKYSLFGKLFAHYDFYLFGGAGALGVAPAGTPANTCSDATMNGATLIRSCGISGARPGPTAGLGLHTWFNQFVALNVELRDWYTQMNPSGRDVNGDSAASSADATWQQTFMVTGNITLYFPTVAAISP
jgi:outer membrane beta-barrel protein